MKIIFTVSILLFFKGLTFSQHNESNKSNQIIEKAIEAKGGKELFKSIKTMYSNSETVMDGRHVRWVTKEMIPNKGSFDIIHKGRLVYKSFYDGTTGYEVVNGIKKKADQEEFKDKNYRKNIMNELDYLDSTLYILEYLGLEKVNNKDCDKVKATLVNGKVTFLYYDQKTSFLIKSEVVLNPEKNSFSIILHDDYKKFGDLICPTKETLVTENGNLIVKTIDLLYNVGISEKDFH